MATLDNFHTGNRPERLYPALRARNAYIQQGLNDNRSWDPASQGPVAPVATYNPADRSSSHIDGPYEERLTLRSMKNYLVPTHPQTKRIYNDTVSGVQLVQNDLIPRTTAASFFTHLLSGRRRTVLPTTYSRFQPYLR